MKAMLDPRMVAASSQALASFTHGTVAAIDCAAITSQGVLMLAVFQFASSARDSRVATLRLNHSDVNTSTPKTIVKTKALRKHLTRAARERRLQVSWPMVSYQGKLLREASVALGE
jgi:hypothetical protein